MVRLSRLYDESAGLRERELAAGARHGDRVEQVGVEGVPVPDAVRAVGAQVESPIVAVAR